MQLMDQAYTIIFDCINAECRKISFQLMLEFPVYKKLACTLLNEYLAPTENKLLFGLHQTNNNS